MKKPILLFSSFLLLSMATPVFAQNADRIAELEAQIAELQSELDELLETNGSEEAESQEKILGTFEDNGITMVFKEAYLVDDEYANSGKSILFFIEFTNDSGELQEPSSAIIFTIDAKQESEIQVFDLEVAALPRYEEETHKNRYIELKDGATIEIEFAYELELADAPITLQYSLFTDSEGEELLTLDPKELSNLGE
ncbi:DUF5067 domain-containing protein [Fundicoccus culcitae]|uniref:DUF5067 domain-containing protein n=1 Tax=Fundicoccus culcitae TaxID=2969821 RepID=A0ABY5P3J3_9LACT|nr:DUF5067 domain-containing protein [Fundicoccus culcitae]UUX33013.1 DUF5067 domain-containing protein [Fundicoccus culcitae]